MDPLAWDNETVNRPGHGEACQVIAEEPGGEIKYFNFPRSFKEIFNFLRGGKYIAYNADFDNRAAVHPKWVPEWVLETLAEYNCAIWGRFRFYTIPGKYFKCWVPGGAGGYEVFDLKSFFQGHSLASAMETYLATARKLDIAEMIGSILGPKEIKKLIGRYDKEKWREYVYSHMDKWLLNPRTKAAATEYAVQDVRGLSDLYKVLQRSFAACGIPDPSLYSPGSASMEIFGGIMLKNKPGDDINKIFRESYFGGRIEVAEMGYIKGPLYYYDIKSAYPYECSNLPDLSTAEFRSGPGYNYSPIARIKCGCYQVRVTIPDNWKFGPFPVKNEFNKIYFPVGTFNCSIGKAGFDLIKEYKLNYELINYWEFYGGSKKLPFKRLINKLFKLRKDPLKSLAVKLLLNAGPYGKSSESDNHSQALPPHLKEFQRMFNSDRAYGKYTNFAYAAQITERTRLRLWREAHEHGAVLLATDGIITRGQLKTGNKLGDWDIKGKLSKAFILGCGRYEIVFNKWQSNSKGQKWKSEYHFRGFRGAAEIFKNLKKCRGNSMPAYLLDGKSLKQWAGSLNKSDFNVLKRIKKDIIISDEKRYWEPGEIKSISGWFKTRKISLPIKEDEPYGKENREEKPAGRNAEKRDRGETPGGASARTRRASGPVKAGRGRTRAVADRAPGGKVIWRKPPRNLPPRKKRRRNC